MQLEGILLDDITFVYTLKACGNMGAIEKGLELHFDVLCNCLEKTLLLEALSLICMPNVVWFQMQRKCKLCLIDFLVIHNHDVASWKAKIVTFAKQEQVMLCSRRRGTDSC